MISLNCSTIQSKDRERAELEELMAAWNGSIETLPGVQYKPRPIYEYKAKPRIEAPVVEAPMKAVIVANREKRLQALPKIMELAKTHGIVEVSRITGFGRTTIKDLSDEFNFTFYKKPIELDATDVEINTVRELAKTSSCNAVQMQTGIGRKKLLRIAKDNGFEFCKDHRFHRLSNAEIEQIRELAKTVGVSEAERITGHSRRKLSYMADKHGFEFKDDSAKNWGKGRLLTADQLQKHAERLRAFRDIGLSRKQAATKAGIAYRTFQRICDEFDISFGD